MDDTEELDGANENNLENLHSDTGFTDEVRQLMAEVKDRVAELRQRGIDEATIGQVCSKVSQPSRLVVSAHYRLFLPEYSQTEVKMAPLPKTIFFLYLKHPEGIAFKNLSAHRKELMHIYEVLSPRISVHDYQRSISDVTNPGKNSINEKCARIREAFASVVGDALANCYCVTGKRGLAKSIVLPRNLVEWEVPMP